MRNECLIVEEWWIEIWASKLVYQLLTLIEIRMDDISGSNGSVEYLIFGKI